jgi:hypothetical protein
MAHGGLIPVTQTLKGNRMTILTPALLQAISDGLLIGFTVGTACLLPVYGLIGLHIGQRLPVRIQRPETPAQRLARLGPPTWEWQDDSRYL